MSVRCTRRLRKYRPILYTVFLFSTVTRTVAVTWLAMGFKEIVFIGSKLNQATVESELFKYNTTRKRATIFFNGAVRDATDRSVRQFSSFVRFLEFGCHSMEKLFSSDRFFYSELSRTLSRVGIRILLGLFETWDACRSKFLGWNVCVCVCVFFLFFFNANEGSLYRVTDRHQSSPWWCVAQRWGDAMGWLGGLKNKIKTLLTR